MAKNNQGQVEVRVASKNGKGGITKTQGYKKTQGIYWRELNAVVSEMVPALMQNESVESAAGKAYMSPTTLNRLISKKTRWPQWWTVWRLARAAGYDLSIKAHE